MKNSPGKPALGQTPIPARSALPQSSALPESAVRREGFRKSMRLHARGDFDDLFKRGRVVVDQVLVIHGRAVSSGGRVGISISKRVGHAPCRNRWKRLIREAYRRLAPRSPALQRMDLVIRPRRGAEPNYAAIERSLSSLTSRLDRQLNRQDRS